MTPTTSLNGVPLVAAITNAGYYAELAGGGLSRPQIFRETLAALLSR
jgi:enoyl reductase-like protein